MWSDHYNWRLETEDFRLRNVQASDSPRAKDRAPVQLRTQPGFIGAPPQPWPDSLFCTESVSILVRAAYLVSSSFVATTNGRIPINLNSPLLVWTSEEISSRSKECLQGYLSASLQNRNKKFLLWSQVGEIFLVFFNRWFSVITSNSRRCGVFISNNQNLCFKENEEGAWANTVALCSTLRRRRTVKIACSLGAEIAEQSYYLITPGGVTNR